MNGRRPLERAPDGAPSQWRHAYELCDALERQHAQLSLLLLLARLPLAWSGLLECLSGLDGPASVYRALGRLAEAGLIGSVRTRSDAWVGADLWPARSFRLLYLTDLGLATVAAHADTEPWLLARRQRLRRVDLLADLAALPHLIALYGLLGALARSYGARPELLAWERPWRVAAAVGSGASLTLPAYASLGWRDVPCPTCQASGPPSAVDCLEQGEDAEHQTDGCGGLARGYLLLPDLGGVPVTAYGRTLVGLLGLRAEAEAQRIHAPAVARGGDIVTSHPPFPCLALAATGNRRAEWQQLCRDVADLRWEGALHVRTTTWEAVWESSRPGGAARSAGVALSGVWAHDVGYAQRSEHGDCRTAELLARRPTGVRLHHRHPTGRLAVVVGTLQSATPEPPALQNLGGLRVGSRTTRPILARVGEVALELTPADRALLDTLAQHPFLSAPALATVHGFSTRWTRASVRRLLRLGLVRQLTAKEIRAPKDSANEVAKWLRRGLLELTPAGLLLAAAQRGLTLRRAIEEAGFAGGGPDTQLGAREGLLAAFLHTVGADDLVVGLYATARQRRRSGHVDEVEEWQGAARAAQGHFRPDAQVRYRRDDTAFTLSLEYDRGTMRLRDYRRKFAAHYDHRDTQIAASGSFAPPLVLVIAPDDDAETRVIQGFAEASVGRGPALPLLLTLRELAAQPDGLLGAIWRTPTTEERRRWKECERWLLI